LTSAFLYTPSFSLFLPFYLEKFSGQAVYLVNLTDKDKKLGSFYPLLSQNAKTSGERRRRKELERNTVKSNKNIHIEIQALNLRYNKFAT